MLKAQPKGVDKSTITLIAALINEGASIFIKKNYY